MPKKTKPSARKRECTARSWERLGLAFLCSWKVGLEKKGEKNCAVFCSVLPQEERDESLWPCVNRKCFFKRREVTRECPAEVLLGNKTRIVGFVLNCTCFSPCFLGCVGFFNIFFPFYHPCVVERTGISYWSPLTQRWALLVALLL